MTSPMKALLAGLVAGAFVLVPMSAAQDATDADVKAIEDIWQTYQTTRVAADAEAWLSLWDEAALKMSGGKPTQTMDDMRAGAAKKFVPGALAAMEITANEVVVVGDWAFSSGDYTVDPVVDGKPLHLEGKFLTVLKRQDDGSWKIFRDSASMNN